MVARPALLRTAPAVVAASALLLGAVPAQALDRPYVALGDSYSSGTGTRTYLADGTSCQRSLAAYPALLAKSRGLTLDFRACSGATTSDVAALQLGTLGPATSYVSITIGGNDAGFSSVLSECAMPAWASNCGGAIDKAVAIIDRTLPTRLASLFSSIRTRAPHATVVVAGYPRIFNGEDCNLATWFSSTEMSRLNATADRLNNRLSAEATKAGLVFANPAPAFVGHAVCDDSEWLNGLSNPVVESYHPKPAGHQSGYAPVVDRLLGTPASEPVATTTAAAADAGTSTTAASSSTATASRTATSSSTGTASSTATASSTGTASVAPLEATTSGTATSTTTAPEGAVTDEQLAAELVERQRPYAAADRRITPKPFRAPDLASAAVRAAARRAGVDLTSRASIDEADRLHSARQAR